MINMDNIVTGTTGLIHLISSTIALVTGLLVLTTTKGTTRHKNRLHLCRFNGCVKSNSIYDLSSFWEICNFSLVFSFKLLDTNWWNLSYFDKEK